MPRSQERVFVSFSGRDARTESFVGRLLQRLNDHREDLAWMYARVGHDVPMGEDIGDACKAEIAKATLFVAVVTANALESPYCRLEVAYALEHPRPRGMLLLKDTICAIGGWPPPYDLLAARKQAELDFPVADAVESAVQLILGSLEIPYLPDEQDEPTFPLQRRLFEELAPLASRQLAGPDELRTLARRVAISYRQGDFRAARNQLAALIGSLSIQFPQHAFYYPRLSVVILEAQRLASAAASNREWQELLTELTSLRNSLEPGGYDENLPAAIGYVHQALGKHLDALRAYEEAERMVERTIDPDIAYNIIVSCINLDRAVPTEQIDRLSSVTVEGIAVTSRANMTTILALRSLAYIHNGRVRSFITSLADWCSPEHLVRSDVALRIFSTVESLALATTDSMSLTGIMARLQTQLGEGSRSLQDWFALELSNSKTLFLSGHCAEAASRLRELCRKAPCSPLPVVQLALHDKARGLKLDPAALGTATRMPFDAVDPAMRASDFNYVVGLAWWLLGDHRRAAIKFEESNHDPRQNYDTLLQSYTAAIARHQQLN